jgi:glyoxylate utilization-related uncharacterized protein
MFGQQGGADQLVVDEAAHDLHVGTIDRIPGGDVPAVETR